MKVPPHMLDEIVASLGEIFGNKRYADRAIEFTFKRHRKWGSRDRRIFAESIYECVRWWRWFWHLAGLRDEDHARTEEITPERISRVWAAYWLSHGRELPHEESGPLLTTADVQKRSKMKVSDAIRASIPDWLDARCTAELGVEWPRLREALNEPAEVFLRVNTLKADRRTVRENMSANGFESESVEDVPSALKLVQRQNVFGTEAFKKGLFEVQDAASQLIAPFLEVAPGMKVIDACAGGGGKALHMAAMMRNKGKIHALDVHAWKLAELKKRAARAGVDIIETREIEGSKTIKRLAAHADRVLLDVPCSGLGVLRRNPDSKWKLSEEEVNRLVTLQAEILENYARMVKPGGKLVYATCSILASENERQVQHFLHRHSDEWQLEAELRRNPVQGGFDGFYAARLIHITAKQEPAPEEAPIELPAAA
ncbi:MAG: methyltransferase domain-containing protein [Verrucomicrobiaceae bacterium]|nr:methyltransferase domain-containing protein [Verrucomicrobiaceae bacterium]